MKGMKKMKMMSAVLAALALVFTMRGTAAAETFPKFSTVNLGGSAVTEAIFAQHKITMINFWATWCPPCVAEMPDLGELYRELPEGAGLIGVLTDGGQNGAAMKAAQILNKSSAGFPQLHPSREMAGVLNEIQAIPTSIFVDSKGNIVGSPIVGANSKEFYKEAMRNALKLAGY